MPKPNFDKIEPIDIPWIEDAIDFYIKNLKSYQHPPQVIMNGIKKLEKIKKILSDTTEKEYDNNQFISS